MDLSVILQLVLMVGGTLGVMLGIILVLGLFVQTVAEFLFGKMEGMLIAIFPLLAPVLGKSGLRVGIIAIFTCGLGIWAANLYQLDIVFLIASLFSKLSEVDTPILSTFFGRQLTGIVIGMGASYVHDLIITPLLNHFKPKETVSGRSSG